VDRRRGGVRAQPRELRGAVGRGGARLVAVPLEPGCGGLRRGAGRDLPGTVDVRVGRAAARRRRDLAQLGERAQRGHRRRPERQEERERAPQQRPEPPAEGSPGARATAAPARRAPG
jgi:hypothetical protein